MKVLGKLPVFVAANIDKLPLLKPEEYELCAMARKITVLEQTVFCQKAQAKLSVDTTTDVKLMSDAVGGTVLIQLD